MNGGVLFSKLDIRQAYNNLELRECDRKLTTINTTKGLYLWTRLPYGVSSSTAIFQQTMDKVLQGLKGVVCRVDDILITGRTDEEHLDRLEDVVNRLAKANFRCNLKKSKFLREEVKYLGYLINRVGIRPCQEKVGTLKEASYPDNLNQLISFLGAVNYYGRFIRNLSTIVEPLNRLRRGVPWEFGMTEKAAFDQLKEALTSSAVLVPYNPRLPVKIDTDASATGIGAVISHIMEDGSERPIEMASRTLTTAERNYAQIEKEALSLVWGVKKFHKFVYAREFTLVTDHKPLLFILKENKSVPEMGASRIMRWAVLLSSYQYRIQYRPTEKHSNADVCSRYPLKDTEEGEDNEVSEIFYNTFVDLPIINFISISKFTVYDVTLSKVRKFILEGWPNSIRKEQVNLKPYFERKDELTVERGCILWGIRVVVPDKLRKDVLELLHVTHQGVVAVKAVARSYVWWPKINQDIELLTRQCSACQDGRNNPPRSRPHPWTPTKTPWERIHGDFCGPVNGVMWLIVVDAHTKWIEAINMRHCTTSPATIKELRKLFATFGLPTTFVSDNGPQLVSKEMEQFLERNGILQVPVPKYKPNTNGLAERAVQSFKTAMDKMSRANPDFSANLARWLLHHRNTPSTSTKQTPAMKMFGRPTRTRLSLLDPLTNRLDRAEFRLNPNERLRSFCTGDTVRVLDVRSDEWYPGVITGSEGCKVYLVKTRAGLERRHVDHIISAMDLTMELPTDNVEHVHNPVPEPEAVAVPESVSEPSIEPNPPGTHLRTGLVSKQPSLVIPKSTMPVPSGNAGAVPIRVSSRQKSTVDKLGYSKLGG